MAECNIPHTHTSPSLHGVVGAGATVLQLGKLASASQTCPTHTHTGNPLPPAGELIPGCCPEGVVQFCSQQITSACNPYLSDTPYRLEFASNATTGTKTFVNFDLKPVTMGPQLGAVDCSQTDVKKVS